MRISNDLIRSVIDVGMTGPDDRFIPLGTGFLLLLINPQGIKTLGAVTAAHVVAKGSPMIRYNTSTGMRIAALPFESHQDADVALGKIDPSVVAASDHGVVPELSTVEPSTEPEVGDDLRFFALHPALRSQPRIEPLMRSGILSAIPSDPVPVRWSPTGAPGNRIEAYLAEARSIAGMSGSPVFVIGATGTVGLLGVNHGHFETVSPDGPITDGVSLVTPTKKIRELAIQLGHV